jgi:adenylate cyclase class IV
MKRIEVEQKFLVGDNVKDRLRSLGFVPSPCTKFVDHYYDQSTLALSLRDTWLRFRAVSPQSGQWQLKRGKNRSDLSSSTAAIYEEIEGEDAISEALNMLEDMPKNKDDDDDDDDDDENNNLEEEEPHNYFLHPPKIPTTNTKGLTPFCSLETNRESFEWLGARSIRNDNKPSDSIFEGIQVDLDQTNLGYVVGEVEKVVYDESQVEKANEEIAAALDQILQGKPRQNPPSGKLEYYLENNRPEHYEALIRQGILKPKK